MVNAIDEVTHSIEEGTTAILEYQNSIREVEWAVFDLIQDQISNITSEAEFLIDLLDSKDLYDDKGQLTDNGLSTMGLHGVNYNVYMAQADKYAKEMAKINKDLASDPYDQELIKRKQELLELQQESISAAENERDAIRDMVEEGIELELDALSELIDKYGEALDSQKDLYDYQRKIEGHASEIALIEKQLASYQGDDSEESKKRKQELSTDLEEARSDLEADEYDRYISDQQKLLDSLYDEYELILNQRLDNIDALISDMILEINTNASTISTTITEQANAVGYTLTDSMRTIWGTGAGGIGSIITNYGDKFTSAQTTTNTALNNITTGINNMIKKLDEIATKDTKKASTSSSAGSSQASTSKVTKPTTTTTKAPAAAAKTIQVGGLINAGNARIYATAWGQGGGTQYFGSDPIYTVLSEQNGYLLTRWHKASSGYTGWFKKSDVSAYKTGARGIGMDEMAWTQENGAEMIVRPSDGAILTPLAKNDSVLTANASKNIWDMANNPSDFIKNNLGIDSAGADAAATVSATYTQNLDKVVFNLPNVKNYDQLLSSMQKDKNFEKLVMSMTIDRVAGGSSLAKGKAVR